MTKADYLHPVDEGGRAVRASFRVEAVDGQITVYVGSRGGTIGTPSETNAEYNVGLQLLLERLGQIGATIEDAVVDSTRVRALPRSERRLPLGSGWEYPLQLRGRDSDEVRRVIQRAQPGVLRTAAENGFASGNGNGTRAIRLYLANSSAFGTSRDLGAYLVTGSSLYSATAEPDELEQRAGALRNAGGSPPSGNRKPSVVTNAAGSRFLRLPAVVAYVLDRAADRCECCGQQPFRRDDGTTYLEVHHLRPLAEGGSDTVENAVAVCANCHRELHFGRDRVIRRRGMYDRIAMLVEE